MLQLKTRAELLAARSAEKKSSCAFVPTMGALHAGHLSLIDLAYKNAELVYVSVFVNPKQFGPKEDFGTYPRHLDSDLALLDRYPNIRVYTPAVDEVYGPPQRKLKKMPAFCSWYCGASRPDFFGGVQQVLLALFDQVQPDNVVFGEKDFQQLQVVKWLLKAYAYPIEVIAAPVYREKSGLAMSSRNQYLSEAGKLQAAQLYQILSKMVQEEQTLPLEQVLSTARKALVAAGFSIDYLVVVDPLTLESLDVKKAAMQVLAAVYLQGVRLIDTVAFKLKKAF